MKKIWVHKVSSFDDAEKFERAYYSRMSPEERLDIVQFLREAYGKINRRAARAHRKGLRRVVKIIQQKQS